MRRAALSLAILLALAVAAQPPPPHPAPQARLAASTSGSWTEYHRDDGHTGYDPTLAQVTSVTNGWTSIAMDGEVYASPVVYGGIVYAATLNNTVYAFNQANGNVIWGQHLRDPETTGWSCGNVSPQGILGTPVIDPAGGRIYVATLGSDDVYRLEGLNLNTGVPELTTVITTPTPGFDWTIQQERGALALANGFVYVPFGGRAGDCGTYHGYVFAVPTSGAAVADYYQTPGSGAGFWTAGGVAVDDSTGKVFVTSGNGTGSGCAANLNGTPMFENDAVVRLSSTLAHEDSFVPLDWQANWCSNDQDLGSAGPLLISSSLLFQAGKWGGGFLLNPNSLGGMNGQLYPPQSPYNQAEVCFGNHSDATFGSYAYAAPFVYLECEGRGLVALNVNTSTPSFSPCNASCAAPDWHAGGSTTFGPPIAAAGAVWAASNSGLSAFNATTGALIFQSGSFGINRFVTPAEAGGQVFVPSHTVIRSFTMCFGGVCNPMGGSLGGNLASGPGSASWSSTRADAFVAGADQALWHIAWPGTSWTSWQALGGVLTSDPAAASWGSGRIDVFVRGSDSALWHRAFTAAGGWYPWEQLGGVLTSGPGVSAQTTARLDVFVRGSDNALWHRVFTASGGWYGWERIGGGLTSDPDAVSWGTGRIDVFVRGGDYGLWHTWWTASGGWFNWESLGGTLISSPAVSSCAAGSLDVFALGTDGGLWRRSFTASAGWGSWQSLGGYWTSSPSATCRPGTPSTDVYVRGADNTLWHLNY